MNDLKPFQIKAYYRDEQLFLDYKTKKILRNQQKNKLQLELQNLYDPCKNQLPYQKKLEELQKNSPEFKEINLKAKVINMEEKMDMCGKLAKRNWDCRKCILCNLPSLLRVDRNVPLTCGIKYCNNPLCKKKLFAETLQSMRSIPDLKGLNNLWHLSIGFDKVPLELLPKQKKEMNRVRNYFFNRLRSPKLIKNLYNSDFHETLNSKDKKLFLKWRVNGMPKLKGICVFDISKGKNKGEWDKNFFPHNHLGLKPIEKGSLSLTLKIIKWLEKDMIKRQKNKVPFHIQSHGYKPIEAILLYLAKRSCGIYKRYEIKEKFVKENWKTIVSQLENKEVMLMKDICSIEFYCDNFLNTRNYSTVGGIPHGTIPRDNITPNYPCKCKYHGFLDRIDVKLTIEMEIPPPNPNFPKNTQENVLYTTEVYN